MQKKKSNLEVVVDFLGHVLTGSAMFVVMALAAFALSRFVAWLPFAHGDDQMAVELLHFVEKCILFADVTFFGWWLVYSTYKAVKELTKE